MLGPMDPVDDGSAQVEGCESAVESQHAAGAQLGWALARAKRTFYDGVAEAVRDLPGGLRGYLVLAALSLGPPPSQLALANQLDLDRTIMTYLLDELETAGLAERRPDPADRRARQVLITKAGTAALAECGSRVEEAERRLMAPLSASEATAFRAMLTRVARADENGPDAIGACPTAEFDSARSGTSRGRRASVARK